MKYYDEDQLSILRLLNNNEYVRVTDELKEQYIFLTHEKLIRTPYEDFADGRYQVARITQQGKAYIAALEEDQTRYREPLEISKRANYISVAAVFLSVIALLKSFGLF
ncbi:MAG: hypothetical protein V8Q42_11200 [Anaerovoracaceae bacterium]